MSVDQGLIDWVREAVEPLGTLAVRPMRGGATLYLDGVVFAIVDESEIWFKADQESDGLWDAEGCDRFTVQFANGRSGTMNYRRAPTDVYDDPDAMRLWARHGHHAGLRAAAKKKPRTRAPRKPKPAK